MYIIRCVENPSIHGIDWDKNVDGENRTPLALACANRHESIINWILREPTFEVVHVLLAYHGLIVPS